MSTPAIVADASHFSVTRPVVKLFCSTSFAYDPACSTTVSPAAAWPIVASRVDGVAERTFPPGVHAATVQLNDAVALPPLPVAVAAKVCVPVARELKEVGLVQVLAEPPSSLQDTDVAFVVVQANVADVEVVDVGGVCVKLIVGAGLGVGEELVTLHV